MCAHIFSACFLSKFNLFFILPFQYGELDILNITSTHLFAYSCTGFTS
ncbi:MAG: hypothetical protein WCG25_01430 [bacterium]